MPIPKVFLRTAYNYDMDAVSKETAFACEGESLTVQSEKDDADINVMMRRFGVTGQVPITSRMPSYQDFDAVFDFRSALETVRQAEEAFLQVPADIRARFHNDPGAFVDFCSNPKNVDELRKLGLADAAPAVVDAASAGDTKPVVPVVDKPAAG